MTVKFKTPPINELVVGVYFEREIQPLRAEHIGLFWGSVRKDFPNIQQQGALVPPPVGNQTITFGLSAAGEVYPMPRFWLEAADSAHLIQIQKNAFFFNWRNRGGNYPHFETVKQGFDRNLALFAAFVESELKVSLPSIQIAELTYINLIESCEYWSDPRDTAKIFPRFCLPVPDEGAVAPADFNFTVAQKLAKSVSLTTSIRSGRSVQNRPGLVFDLRGIGLLGSVHIRDANQWFDDAHEIIGSSFIAMTNEDIQDRYWGRIRS
jgi:uncharacterized protein (TIGR04255 family)